MVGAILEMPMQSGNHGETNLRAPIVLAVPTESPVQRVLGTCGAFVCASHQILLAISDTF